MQTLTEYLGKRPIYESKTISFRGNPDNKAYIQQFKADNQIPTEGEALDFIINTFKTSYNANVNSSVEDKAKDSLLLEKDLEIQRLQAQINNLNNIVHNAGEQPVNTGNNENVSKTVNTYEHVDYTFTMFEDERIQFLKQFRDETDKHPFDTIAGFKTQVEASMLRFVTDPLHILQGKEYEALLQWDKEVFTPGMRALTGIADLELTGRDKFLLMLDFVQNDPVAALPRIGLPEALQQKIEDLSFPRLEAVRKLLIEKQLLNADEVVSPEQSGG